ncbi:MAG TPA: DUF4388 domain-containing protein [Acidimicrobiia bacterium]
MSLSGNLGFVSIDEVLRLLTRSKQQGSVNVTGNSLRGRVFVGKGGIDLATTSDNDELHRLLLNSGYADEKTLNRVTTGETTLAAIAEDNQPIVDLLREMTVESLYQISSRGTEFQVHEGATTPYASPKSFDLEGLLQDTEERRREWSRVSEVIPDLDSPVGFRRDLGDREEVSIKEDDWKVLSEIGAGASVTEIADFLGTTEFWTARVAARLLKNELVVLRGTDDAADESYEDIDEPEPDNEYVTPSDDHSHQPGVAEDAEHEQPEAEPSVFQDEVSVHEDEDVDPDQSWWEEQAVEDEPVEDDDSRTPEVVAEGLSEIPPVQGTAGDSEAEEDTEAFLEKVFSELDSSEPEAEEGHGLLRRRRMGSLRDFSSDS